MPANGGHPLTANGHRGTPGLRSVRPVRPVRSVPFRPPSF